MQEQNDIKMVKGKVFQDVKLESPMTDTPNSGAQPDCNSASARCSNVFDDKRVATLP